MGCGQSKGQAPLLYTNLKEELKKKLIEAIQADDIVALAQIQAKENFASNFDLSDDGTMWTSIHFCCRFDAVCCLDFLLKKSYAENVKQYTHFVNQQNSEGHTCLHLCGSWVAPKCFALLIKYGGLNLSLLDKRLRTAQMIMKGCRIQQMQETISALRAKEGNVTEWNYKFLHQKSDIPKLRLSQFYKEELKLAKGKSKLKDPAIQLLPTEDQIRLRQQKENLQQAIEQLYGQIKQKEKDLNESQKKMMQTKEEQIIVKVDLTQQKTKKFKSEQVRQLQMHLQQKSQRLQKIKQNISKIKEDKIEALLELQNQKVDLNNQQTKQELALQFSKLKKDILENKEKYHPLPKPIQGQQEIVINKPNQILVRANPNQYPRQHKVQSFGQQNSNFQKLPENIKERYRKAKLKGFFEDQQFPPRQSSLGDKSYQKKINQFRPRLAWLRPDKFIGPNFVLFEGIETNDIRQGELGVCYMLATISDMARHPQRIKDIFQFYDLKLGFYVLKFYTNGTINYVVIDDYTPCDKDSKHTLYSHPVGNEIWVVLLEKAWAKVIGSYFSAEGMAPSDSMQELQGGPTQGGFLNQKGLMKLLFEAVAIKEYIVVLSSRTDINIKGIANCHAYSVLKIVEHKGSYLFKLRNPWGCFEWDGCYGEKSKLWTPELRKKCQQRNGDDGQFYLTERQLYQAFNYYSLGVYQSKSQYNYVQIKSQPEQPFYFKFKVTKRQKLSLRVFQPFDRIVQDKSYRYSPLLFELGKIQANSVTFLSEGNNDCLWGQKSCHIYKGDIFKQYDAGEYFVRIVMKWTNPTKYNTAVFSIYSSEEPCNIEKLSQAQGIKLWIKLAYGFIQGKELNKVNEDISRSTEWMRGQAVCMAIVNPTAKGDSFRVRWTFKSKDFVNCKTLMNRVNNDVIEFVVTKKQMYNCGTLMKIRSNQTYNSGYSVVESFRLQAQPQHQSQKEPQNEQQVESQNEQQVEQQIVKPIIEIKIEGEFPETIKQRYRKAKQKYYFEDEQFPPNQTSFGGQRYSQKIQPLLDKSVWTRPAQFIGPHFVLFDNLTIEDIKLGKLDTSHCLATLGCYAANNPKIIKDAFVFYDTQLGFYVLRFYVYGKLEYVVVDDFMPCDLYTNEPLFAQPVNDKIWVMIIEKAWAKIFGGYFAVQGLYPHKFMEAFTGNPVYGAFFSETDNKTDQLIGFFKKNYTIVLKTNDPKIQGIVAYHDYSLLNIFQDNGINIYQVRNPWGHFEWNGQYGEQSSLWTPQLRKKCNFKKGDDGVFFLSESQVINAFYFYSVGLYQPNLKYSCVGFQSQPQESLYFKFKITKKGRVATRLTQPFQCMIADSSYKYSPTVFEVAKIKNTSVVFMSEGSNQCFYGENSVFATNNIYEEYQAGQYFVRIKTIWVNPKKFNSAVLSVYCGESVVIERLKESQGFKLWRQMIYNCMQDAQLTDLDDDVSYGVRKMRGQSICYATIRQTEEEKNYKLKWNFDKKLNNCKLALNKLNENAIEFTIGLKERFNFGTVDCIILKEAYEIGPSRIQAKKC